MISFIWPIALVVLSNVVYQICAKSVSGGIDPFASLAITYTVGAAVSVVLYYVFNRGANVFREFGKLNWASFVLGIAIVGLEVGYIYAYKAGWQISVAQIIQSAVLAIILIFVGYILYHETVTWNKIAGVFVCLVGLGLIGWNK